MERNIELAKIYEQLTMTYKIRQTKEITHIFII